MSDRNREAFEAWFISSPPQIRFGQSIDDYLEDVAFCAFDFASKGREELLEALKDMLDLVTEGFVRMQGAKLYPAGEARIEEARAVIQKNSEGAKE